MASFRPVPVIDFYRRDGCTLCDEARAALQAVLEERVRRGDPIGRVREHNLSQRPELEARYGVRIPVIGIGTHEIELVTSPRAVAAFLDRTLGRQA
jgi:hypothetical protein